MAQLHRCKCWAGWNRCPPDPATKAADPAKVKAFTDANPDVLLQRKYFAAPPVPANFGSVNYWVVHAFGFVNAQG